MRLIRSAGGFDGLAAIGRQCGAFFGVSGRDCRRDGARGAGGPDTRLLLGAAAGLRAQERGADRGGDGPQRDQREASVAAAFSRQGRVVRREGARQGARSGAAADRAARADRSLDHRRHQLPQMRIALGGRVAPILRPARQAGQLPGRRLAVGGQSRRQPARRLSAVSARELGEGRGAPQDCRRSREDRVSDQAEDRAAADRMGVRGRHCARRGGDGLRVRLGLVAASAHHGAGAYLCGGGVGQDAGMQGRQGGAARSPSQRPISPRVCRSGRGARSAGATAPMRGSPRASPACGCAPPARVRPPRSPRSG